MTCLSIQLLKGTGNEGMHNNLEVVHVTRFCPLLIIFCSVKKRQYAGAVYAVAITQVPSALHVLKTIASSFDSRWASAC
jgi:hypothetical protein